MEKDRNAEFDVSFLADRTNGRAYATVRCGALQRDSVSKRRSDIVTSFIHFFCAEQFTVV